MRMWEDCKFVRIIIIKMSTRRTTEKNEFQTHPNSYCDVAADAVVCHALDTQRRVLLLIIFSKLVYCTFRV